MSFSSSVVLRSGRGWERRATWSWCRKSRFLDHEVVPSAKEAVQCGQQKTTSSSIDRVADLAGSSFALRQPAYSPTPGSRWSRAFHVINAVLIFGLTLQSDHGPPETRDGGRRTVPSDGVRQGRSTVAENAGSVEAVGKVGGGQPVWPTSTRDD
jgi:hypothetical protein